MGQVRPVAAGVEMMHQMGQPKMIVVVVVAVDDVVVAVVVVLDVVVTVVACYGGYGYDNNLYE